MRRQRQLGKRTSQHRQHCAVLGYLDDDLALLDWYPVVELTKLDVAVSLLIGAFGAELKVGCGRQAEALRKVIAKECAGVFAALDAGRNPS